MAVDAASDRAHHGRRLLGRDPNEPHRAATPLELLFDLTFVVAFGVAADELARYLAEGEVWPADRRVRVRDVRGLLGVDQLLVVRVGVRHGRLAVPARDDDADGRRDRARARARAGVRLDRQGRHARQRRGGGGVRRDACADGVPLGEGGARQPGAPPRGGRLHLDDLRGAVLLGPARGHRPADRDDVRDRARPHRDRDVDPYVSERRKGGTGTRVISPSATACW